MRELQINGLICSAKKMKIIKKKKALTKKIKKFENIAMVIYAVFAGFCFGLIPYINQLAASGRIAPASSWGFLILPIACLAPFYGICELIEKRWERKVKREEGFNK